jgi:oligopeptide/dipeptide ABC transporter ATP-binding protein
MAMLFITHDLDLAAAVCDRTSVMYAGSVVEAQRSDRLYASPRHPYSAALSHARPSIEAATHRLPTVPGTPVSAFEVSQGCVFASRCPFCLPLCEQQAPPVEEFDGGIARCHRSEELAGTLNQRFEEAARDLA